MKAHKASLRLHAKCFIQDSKLIKVAVKSLNPQQKVDKSERKLMGEEGGYLVSRKDDPKAMTGK